MSYEEAVPTWMRSVVDRNYFARAPVKDRDTIDSTIFSLIFMQPDPMQKGLAATRLHAIIKKSCAQGKITAKDRDSLIEKIENLTPYAL